MRPPMMLNRVDLPQPEGPITARNSPAHTLSETRSTAIRGPSGVSNCLTMSSTARMPAWSGVRAPAAPDFGKVVTLVMEYSIGRRVGKAKRAHPHLTMVGTLRLAHPMLQPYCLPKLERSYPDFLCDTAPESRAP